MVLFVVLYLVAVETAWGQRAGNAALAGRHNRPPDLIDTSLDLLATISVLSLALAGGAICLIGLIRGGWRLGFGVGTVILFSNITTQVLKNDVLTRPFLVAEGDIFGWGNSLPSGHATVAMSLVVGLALVLPPQYRWLGVIPTTFYAIGSVSPRSPPVGIDRVMSWLPISWSFSGEDWWRHCFFGRETGQRRSRARSPSG